MGECRKLFITDSSASYEVTWDRPSSAASLIAPRIVWVPVRSSGIENRKGVFFVQSNKVDELEPWWTILSQYFKALVTFVTWPSLHSQSSSRLCNTTFSRCCQSWEKFWIFRKKSKIIAVLRFSIVTSDSLHEFFPTRPWKWGDWCCTYISRHQVSHNCLVRLVLHLHISRHQISHTFLEI